MSTARASDRRITARVGASGAPEETHLTLAAFLPYRLSVLAAAVSEGLARSYSARFGVSIPEWRVLATVAEFGSITAKAVGRHARMNKVKVSRAAAALEARGLLRRKANEADLREAFLALTPAGRALFARIEPLALAYADDLTAELPPSDLAALDRLIEALMRRAGPRDAAPESCPAVGKADRTRSETTKTPGVGTR